jgi:hypothetical protein
MCFQSKENVVITIPYFPMVQVWSEITYNWSFTVFSHGASEVKYYIFKGASHHHQDNKIRASYLFQPWDYELFVATKRVEIEPIFSSVLVTS